MSHIKPHPNQFGRWQIVHVDAQGNLNQEVKNMRKDIIPGLLLITLGAVSLWAFCTLGETDGIGPIFIMLLGAGQVYASIREAQIARKRRIAKMRKGSTGAIKKGSTYIGMTVAESITPPTKADYRETRRMLDDFCIIGVNVPRLRTRQELYNWRRQVISDYLEGLGA